MTIATDDNTFSYTGNGVTTAFSFPRLFYSEDHLVVTVDGVTKTITTDYTVSGEGAPSGGTVTFLSAPASSTSVIIQRVVPYTQETDFENFDGNPADVTEEQFDLLAMMAQQLAEADDRAVKAPVGDTRTMVLPSATDRAGKIMSFDAEGDVTATTFADLDAVEVSAFMETVLDDTTASAARTTLGLGTAATQNTGTSGGNVPLMNGANTWSGVQTFSAQSVLSGAVYSRTALVADDAATSFVSPITQGIVCVTYGTNTAANRCGIIGIKVNSGTTTASLAVGSGLTVNTTTGTLAGTTGVDGEFTFRVDQASLSVYVENRLGGAVNVALTFIGLT